MVFHTARSNKRWDSFILRKGDNISIIIILQIGKSKNAIRFGSQG